MQLTTQQKQQITDHPILRQEGIEQIKREESFKTAFCLDIDQDLKESNQILNNYYGGY